jgi:hypothetical protein
LKRGSSKKYSKLHEIETLTAGTHDDVLAFV